MTTFSSKDDAMTAWAEIRTLRTRVHEQVAAWRLLAKIEGVNPKELERFNWALDDLLATFSDTFDGVEKTADEEMDEDPWLREVNEKAWRLAGESVSPSTAEHGQ